MSATPQPPPAPDPLDPPPLPFSPRQAFVGVLILTALVYAQVLTFEFLNFDDQTYVWKNTAVLKGLTWDNVHWAFTHGVSGHWHPLTVMTHMLDVSIWGVGFPGGHHLTNVLFHLANVCLLYLFMTRLTARPWISVIVTALFALHPIHVESVAWVSIRKDVLSQFFGLLTLLVYLDYVRKKGTGPFSGAWRYVLMIVLFALGLMSKAVLVTLPASMLLLDFWPLRRWEKVPVPFSQPFDPISSPIGPISWVGVAKCFLEKIPFFALSGFASYMTLRFMTEGKVLSDTDVLPNTMRFHNALISYVIYLRKLILPSDLGTQYSYPLSIPTWQWGGALVILAVITIAVLSQIRVRPYLIVGWLWFVGTIFPVSGIKQAGMQPMADRYAYLSFIGLYLILALAGAEAVKRLNIRTPVIAMALGLLGLAMTALTFVQISYWQNTTTLFSRAIALDDNNWLAHINLGDRFREKGDYDTAMDHFMKAHSIVPREPHALKNIALIYSQTGHAPEAIEWYNKARESDPTDPVPPQNLGWLYFRQNRLDLALQNFLACNQIAIDKGVESAEPHMGLGAVYEALHDDVNADLHFKKAVEIAPDYLVARYNYGVYLFDHHRTADAMVQFNQILKLDPTHAPTLDYLAKHNVPHP